MAVHNLRVPSAGGGSAVRVPEMQIKRVVLARLGLAVLLDVIQFIRECPREFC